MKIKNQHNNFSDIYLEILDDILNEGKEVTVREKKVKEEIPYMFKLTNPRNRLLNLKGRDFSFKYIFGELLWYLTGRNDVEFISKYSKMWKRLSDDGITNNSAYGHYIFREIYGNKSQWQHVKDLLKEDPFSRQAIIHIKPPQLEKTKDTVCTLDLSFSIRDGKLDLLTHMRSNDVFYGLTYDLFMFTFMQELMAAELDVELGEYTHLTNNMHIYEKDFKEAQEILDNAEPNFYNYKTEMLPIPSNFMENDLPMLVAYERHKGDELFIDGDETLSDLTRDLARFYKIGKVSNLEVELNED